ncbi:DUF4064 domain-containing protein [Viridibacillus arvi]|uniref:DUF4064 domain-containing protein n=1 Tax=Viridibacillus arvi TaxID=263475 RepID=A0A0M0L950_9BACL|nr:DUF4064 domain-containing protein [Viridibacillus arvi]KOO47387.1 hypothetical protein AMD00_22265 [Viridibacillus arvi]
MKRTGEMALGIIGSVLNVFVIIALAILMFGISTFANDSTFTDGVLSEMQNDPNLTAGEIEAATTLIDNMPTYINAFGWLGVVLLVVSLVLGILGVVYIRKSDKQNVAGTFFILAGVCAGIISLTAILFYIAAIMSFVRKPKVEEIDTFYVNE